MLYVGYHTENTQRVIGKILVVEKRLNLGIRGPGEKPSWGKQDRVVPGVATLDRSPDQSPGVRPISPSTGTKGNQEGWPSWVEYRSGGTGGPHPGVDIFPDLSPRAKPYCGVKCSQGLHFPATDCGAWGDRGHNPPTVEGE